MSAPSLLSFVDAPIVVGDPDGRAAYVNPAFEACFQVEARAAVGRPLASLFDGGLREAVLRAVAQVCDRGASTRFRVRHGGVGYTAVASPIVAGDARVGVVLLMLATSSDDERLAGAQRELRDPVDELARIFDELIDAAGDRPTERHRALVEDGLRVLGRLRKASEGLGRLLSGGAATGSTGRFDPASVLSAAMRRVQPQFEAAGVALEVQAPPQLPPIAGDAGRLEGALVQLLHDRLQASGTGARVLLVARAVERGGAPAVVVAVVDRPGADAASASDAEPASVRGAVRELGGDVRTTSDPQGGRTTAIRLRAARQ